MLQQPIWKMSLNSVKIEIMEFIGIGISDQLNRNQYEHFQLVYPSSLFKYLENNKRPDRSSIYNVINT